MKYTEEILDQCIELFFFDPSEDKNAYTIATRKTSNSIFFKNGKCLYSPMYLLLREVRFCFGVGKEFNPIRSKLEFADYAGILLLDIAFRCLVKKIYKGDFDMFAGQYMGLTLDKIEVIRKLRNALTHNFYSLTYYDKESKIHYYFSISYSYDVIQCISDQQGKQVYGINPRKLYVLFTKGVSSFKRDLLEHNNAIGRNSFRSSLHLDSWTVFR